jgi:succinate dehydrogenase/fumarate reductase-like Fe-S protein
MSYLKIKKIKNGINIIICWAACNKYGVPKFFEAPEMCSSILRVLYLDSDYGFWERSSNVTLS